MKLHLLLMTALASLMASCARMGSPDGGWYDETPPHVVSASPADRGTDVTSRKVSIYFNEFVKLNNATEKVVVSPPQMEMPEIKATGRKITVTLIDSLKPSTTYTVDFSDAITDNNENNPMGNYTYSFSTGEVIDTLEVAGTVLNAENLEPVKGILVGLYSDSIAVADTDTVAPGEIQSPTFIRVSRTDSRGKFIIRGVAPGHYTIGALQDMDGNYRFNSKSEVMAFSDMVIEPSVFLDKRQDTIWADALHIKDIMVVDYNHYLPDNIVLRSFAHEGADRYFLKAERKEPDRFTLFFTAPLAPDSALYARLGMDYESSRLPTLRGLNFDEHDAFVVEPSLRGDTVTYWLRDTMLVNQDTLRMQISTLATDTLGQLAVWVDTLEVLSKTPYEKRLKKQEEAAKEWEKKLEKRRKRLKEGEELTDTIMPVPRLSPNYDIQQNMSPDGTVYIKFPYPLKKVDREAVHLYVEQDSLWYRAPFVFQPVRRDGEIITDSLPRQWELFSEWIPGGPGSLTE
ncbi:MAG: Ig-like domain-containing protein [Prevotellaceae bacterium]|nr:Ig-like domain-containing protein [Prevotellaceae bacterium]